MHNLDGKFGIFSSEIRTKFGVTSNDVIIEQNLPPSQIQISHEFLFYIDRFLCAHNLRHTQFLSLLSANN